MDNATPHCTNTTHFNFFLFGKVKDAIKGMEFESEDDLLDEVIKCIMKKADRVNFLR